jgi:hypothetical protein
MPAVGVYPGGLSELDFLRAYHRTTLRVPQVASDSLLRSLVTAAEPDRPVLVAALGAMAGRAARQLTAVAAALEDRSRPVAERLLGPLPGAPAWVDLIHRVATRPPTVLAGDFGLGQAGVAHAERLRALGDLAWVTPLVELSERDGFLLGTMNEWRHTWEAVWAVVDGVAALALREEDAANVADTTAELVAVARGFLGAYLDGRTGGRRE